MKKFLLIGICFLALLLLALSQLSSDSFTLEFHGFYSFEVERVVVKGGNFEDSYNVSEESWDKISGFKVIVSSKRKSGLVDIRVYTKSEEEFFISNVAFKVGKTTYVSEVLGELIYVKAHWQ